MKGRAERDAQRALLDELAAQVSGESKQGHFPCTELWLDVAGESVPMLFVSRDEIYAWLRDARPGLGAIDVTRDQTQWIASCDRHGEIARGEMTAEGHDECVRAWYAHDKQEHGASGEVPMGDLIGHRLDGAS